MNGSRVVKSAVAGLLGLGCLFALSFPAPAQTTPSERPAVPRLDRLFDELEAADNALLASAISNEIRLIWSDAPDAEGRKTMRAIAAARRARALGKALALSESLTERLPDYAEGWNRKATVLFELGEFARALDTIETVLALEPRHFAALAGKGVILLRQGRITQGRAALRAALNIHPFLPESRLLLPRGDPI